MKRKMENECELIDANKKSILNKHFLFFVNYYYLHYCEDVKENLLKPRTDETLLIRD